MDSSNHPQHILNLSTNHPDIQAHTDYDKFRTRKERLNTSVTFWYRF